jgi:hypothetical protein
MQWGEFLGVPLPWLSLSPRPPDHNTHEVIVSICEECLGVELQNDDISRSVTSNRKSKQKRERQNNLQLQNLENEIQNLWSITYLKENWFFKLGFNSVQTVCYTGISPCQTSCENLLPLEQRRMDIPKTLRQGVETHNLFCEWASLGRSTGLQLSMLFTLYRYWWTDSSYNVWFKSATSLEPGQATVPI